MKYFYLRLLQNLFLLLFCLSCVTTNYYTGRTLEKGKTVLTPGVDNLVIMKENGDVLEKGLTFGVSLGVAFGLPWRFETGIRGYFPYIYEINLRHQINPRTFKWFDLSANLHSGINFLDDDTSSPYYKYGLTISKEIYRIQPYLSYYLNNNYFFKNESENRNDYSIVCFGLAIPYKGDCIFPEVNYMKSRNGINGFFTFGIGLRASIRKAKSNK